LFVSSTLDCTPGEPDVGSPRYFLVSKDDNRHYNQVFQAHYYLKINMAHQQDHSFGFVMYAGIAFAVLVVAIVAFSLFKSGTPPAPGNNAEVEARIRPVANFNPTAIGNEPGSEPSSEQGSGQAETVQPEGDSSVTESAPQNALPDQAASPATASPVVEAAPATPAAASGAAKKPEDIYATLCRTCHEFGVVGAPKKGDKAAWAPRIATGMETLYRSAIEGKGAMPPKGGQPSLSDDEIKASVDYLVNLAR
jgi:cytochrome c5